MNRFTDPSGHAAQADAGAAPALAASLSFAAETLASGRAAGEVLVLEPLSFWGGYDAQRGLIVEQAHPGYGRTLAGKILVMPRAKGSSSSSSVLAEAIRNGTGPAGIVLRERDLIISIGVIVAHELYGISVPLVVADEVAFAAICGTQRMIRIGAPDDGGAASIETGPSPSAA
jgi:predicted aconitase with swiveling domain